MEAEVETCPGTLRGRKICIDNKIKTKLMEQDNKPSPEELLKPRYKVIADYPNSELGIGDLLMQYIAGSVWRHIWTSGEWTDITIHNPEKYPHLFRKLEWWEERTNEEMPQYVKGEYEGKVYGIWKVIFWELDKGRGMLNDNSCVSFSSFVVPATETEYLNQNKSI
jgi:hypothetical protein